METFVDTDVICCSLLGLPQKTKLNAGERKEMKRRTMQMLLYLMRSPFYDNYTR